MLRSLDNNQLAAAGRLFSSAVVQEMARTGKSPLFCRLAHESGLASTMSEDEFVGDFFDAAFSLLKKKAYRYEYAYKAAITHKLLLGVHSLRTASMMTEFRIGACKADLVILNGTSTVYEIKSERDNLDRLANQVATYQKVFAKVNIITADSHLDTIVTMVPDDVGVLLLNDRFQISTVREAKDRSGHIDPISAFESIHKGEAIQILEMMGILIPDVPNTKFYAAMIDIFSALDPVELHECMINVLKATRSLLPLSDLISELPVSLQPAAFSTPLRQRDHVNLLNAVKTPLFEALNWT